MYSIAAILVVLQFAAAHGSKCISYDCVGRIFEHPILSELDGLVTAEESSSDPLVNLNAIEYILKKYNFDNDGPEYEILNNILQLKSLASSMKSGVFLCKKTELEKLVQAERSIYTVCKKRKYGGGLNRSRRLDRLVMEMSDKFIEHCVNVIRDHIEKLPSPVGEESSEDPASVFDEMAVFDSLLNKIQQRKAEIPMLDYLSISKIDDDQWESLIENLALKRMPKPINMTPNFVKRLLDEVFGNTCKLINEQNGTKRQLEDALSFALDVELSFEGRKSNPGHNFGKRLGRYYLCKIALADSGQYMEEIMKKARVKQGN